jgi:hypothetical protein
MLDKIKNVIIGTDHFIPPKPKINPARIKVAILPLLVRNLTLNDSIATTAAIKIPSKKFPSIMLLCPGNKVFKNEIIMCLVCCRVN